ncbi:endonuclease III [Peptoanaerobacter stomatis]|uniref:Endonuclease III n=1 Tax=Peptoanaerobacter stomatis TaxID=796937 RepID=J5WM77_9FIRM|nr:endonuclease III [Peptoanaerobacter stomatis]EHL18547.1 endonuclease III [Peptoanaerobacter stomatis]EJU22992.1 endonuclease III [Peptoanaerobacter stomatis]NWO25670.1 endonuclease III [Peptostreptococcaceae bacterium oral taxon 081]
MNKYKAIIEILKEMYPDATCELNHNTPYELLVATILSAQSTDKRVNIVTKDLFKVADTPEKMVKLGEEKLKEYIRTIGFFNTKSKNLISMSRDLIQKYNSEVPKTMEELTSLAGVGRKTANVVMSNCFKVPAIAVDTHVFRLAHRLGFSAQEDVYKVEMDLQKKIAKKDWTLAHHMLIFHGRYTCKAKNPLCEECNLKEYCLYYKNLLKKKS